VFDTDIAAYYGKADELKAKLKKAGLELTGAYFAMDDATNPDKESAVLARAAEGCGFLQSVGSRFIILNGGAKKEGRTFVDDDYRRLARVMNRIGSDARSKGLQAAIHPHIGYMVERPEEVDRLAAAGIDQELVGLCPHAGHQQHVGADPYVIYDEHPGWARYLHIGDVGKDNKGAVVGQGVLDQKRLMKPLLSAGFDGWVIIEGGQQGVSPEDYATRSREYILRTWPEIKWE
jgi:inosose dehydratase